MKQRGATRAFLLCSVFCILAAPFCHAQQPNCPATPAYTPCDLVFEMNQAEAAAHSNPYMSVELRGEFRSPNHKTYLMPGFWDGGRRLVIRFTPVEPGQWDFRITSNIQRFDGNEGSFQSAESKALGFVRAAAMHHWATHYTENPVDRKPHLWMGDTNYRFAFMDRASFNSLIDKRAEQKFNHERGIILGSASDQKTAFPSPDRPNPEFFRETDSRIRYMNSKGIVFDLILAAGDNALTSLFPTWQDRERFLRYIVGRYSAMNITWQGVQEFETYKDAKPLMKEVGTAIKKMDPYDHPRSTGTQITSSPCAGDAWMSYLAYQTPEDQIGSIEHQLYPAPQVNTDTGRAGASADDIRHHLWNTTMNGQYPTFSAAPDSPAAQFMTNWYNFMDDTRHWEIEPYFDVDGGRGIALENIEYIVYVEKPGPVEVAVEKHGYDVRWYNPISGEFVEGKKFKGDRFTGEPPTRDHDWVLHISREGKKEGMLGSYRFQSRDVPIQLQEPELMPKLVIFEVAEPAGPDLSISKPQRYSAVLKRQTRATRAMSYLWTGEAPGDGQGFRVLGTGKDGQLSVGKHLRVKPDAPFTIHVTAMNANGKLYVLDKIYKLVP